MANDDNPRAFKHAIDERVVRRYAAALGPAGSAFTADALAGLADLELKARVKHLSDCLFRHLGSDFPVAMSTLLPLLDTGAATGAAAVEFAFWPLAQLVEDHGIEHFDVALPAMKAITRHFSCEFAVRPFVVRYPAAMLKAMHAWAVDPDVHVRRNASEGLRPRLPWGMRLQRFIEDPGPVIGVLERLRHDPAETVRRSVANNLNDIAKDHPDVVLEVLTRWDEDPFAHTLWMKRHALRTLVKAGDARALALLGFGRAEVAVEDLRIAAPAYVVGDTLTFSFTLVSTASVPQDLVVDYRVHFVKANGSRRPKVFKLATLTLQPGERRPFERRQHLRPISTRRYHAGEHAIDVQVNGVASAAAPFELRTSVR
ncbi:MAG: DNA alkylation repair protein [Myxococcota bacterium]